MVCQALEGYVVDKLKASESTFKEVQLRMADPDVSGLKSTQAACTPPAQPTPPQPAQPARAACSHAAGPSSPHAASPPPSQLPHVRAHPPPFTRVPCPGFSCSTHAVFCTHPCPQVASDPAEFQKVAKVFADLEGLVNYYKWVGA